MPIRLVTAAALLGGGYLIARRMARRPTRRGPAEPQKSQDPSCLDDIYLPNALWAEPIRQQLAPHDIALLPSPRIDAEAQVMAFDMALALIPTVQGDEQDPARDQIIQAVLEAVAPSCYWEERLMPYTANSRQNEVWDGVGRVHDLARALLVAQGDV